VGRSSYDSLKFSKILLVPETSLSVAPWMGEKPAINLWLQETKMGTHLKTLLSAGLLSLTSMAHAAPVNVDVQVTADNA
jgi:hypothetical protein